VPKIISECCELMKLCHINRSGPVILRHSVDYTFFTVETADSNNSNREFI